MKSKSREMLLQCIDVFPSGSFQKIILPFDMNFLQTKKRVLYIEPTKHS